MAYQMVATAMTLNDLEGYSPVTGLLNSNAIPRNLCSYCSILHDFN